MKMLEVVSKIQKRQDKIEDEMPKIVSSMIEMKAKMNKVIEDSSKIKDDLNKLDVGLEKSIDDKWAEQRTKQGDMLKVMVQEQVNEKMNQVESKLTTVKNSLNEVRSQAVQERDREGRACYIIIYNVPGS